MKYIIEFEDVPYMSENGVNYYTCKSARWYKLGETVINGLTPYTEPDRKDIEDEVWEFVRIITDMTEKQRIECFGGASCNLDKYWTYQDAKAKYEEWKKEKDEIRVGDEVEYECDGIVRFVVTGFCGETAFGFKHQCDYDDVGEYCDIEDLRKTGRHFDEVEELLKKMREE